MRTLADMTPQERAQQRGMWCDFPDPDEHTNLAIYVGDSPNHQGFCELIHEGQLGTLTIPENLTPRPDLPRAWQAAGQPPLTKYWTIEQAADYTQLSTRTIRRRIADGSLTAYRHGRTIRLKPQDIDTLFTRVEPREMDEA